MKKICTEFQEYGMNNFFDLFNSILEKSEYNLNQFVKSDALVIPDYTADDFVDTLKQFMETAPDTVKAVEDRESFWNIFSELDDYENNKKFIKWLSKYVEALIKPYEDAVFLQGIDDTAFVKMSNYCFQNYILKDIGDAGTEANIWDENELNILRKIMSAFIELIFVNNYSKENAIATTKKRFGINEQQSEHWWQLAQENEEKLWRITLMKQYMRIENKLDRLLCEIED